MPTVRSWSRKGLTMDQASIDELTHLVLSWSESLVALTRAEMLDDRNMHREARLRRDVNAAASDMWNAIYRHGPLRLGEVRPPSKG